MAQSKPYWCFIVAGSQVSGPEYLDYCARLEQVHAEVAATHDFTEWRDLPEPFWRRLDGHEYAHLVDTDVVELGVETQEVAIDPPILQRVYREALAGSDIDVRLGTRVTSIRRCNRRYEISTRRQRRHRGSPRVRPGGERGLAPPTRARRVVRLPPGSSMAGSPQVTRPGGSADRAGGCALDVARDGSVRAVHERGRRNRHHIGRQILDGAARFVPSLESAHIRRVEMGVVHCSATTDIDDPISGAHSRSDSGVWSLDVGYHSFDTGKLVLAPWHARLATQRVLAHRELLEQVAEQSPGWTAVARPEPSRPQTADLEHGS